MFLNKIKQFHQTTSGFLVFGLAEVVLGYMFLLWALDTGSLIDWFVTIILLIGAIQNSVKLILSSKRPVSIT